MATVDPAIPTPPTTDRPVIVRAITVITATVVGLTFAFGFGNVLALALRLGVPVWVAPLVAPAVDLSILGLLLGTRHLAVHGATAEQLRPARRLLVFASLATLALNIADPIAAGDYGKAAFDAVGPLLLIGWAEVGPGLLHAIATVGPPATTAVHAAHTRGRHGASEHQTGAVNENEAATVAAASPTPEAVLLDEDNGEVPASPAVDDDLVERARREDARHWAEHQRPISADTLRRRLRIGAARSRLLVSIIRADQAGRQACRVAVTSG